MTTQRRRVTRSAVAATLGTITSITGIVLLARPAVVFERVTPSTDAEVDAVRWIGLLLAVVGPLVARAVRWRTPSMRWLAATAGFAGGYAVSAHPLWLVLALVSAFAGVVTTAAHLGDAAFVRFVDRFDDEQQTRSEELLRSIGFETRV